MNYLGFEVEPGGSSYYPRTEPEPRIARKIHCIPATTAAVERQFSAAGFTLNERRTCLDPAHLDDILFIRAMENIK